MTTNPERLWVVSTLKCLGGNGERESDVLATKEEADAYFGRLYSGYRPSEPAEYVLASVAAAKEEAAREEGRREERERVFAGLRDRFVLERDDAAIDAKERGEPDYVKGITWAIDALDRAAKGAAK